MNTLNAISPVDGRYRDKVADLEQFFSEYALIRYRVKIELEYFLALCELPLPQLAGFPESGATRLESIVRDFGLEDAERIKEIEKTTNHDVKAVEYFLKEKFDMLGLSAFREFLHFGLTSQDINNTAIPLSIIDALREVYYPALGKLILKLKGMA
jgi:adenylosuccinate lyase